MSAATPRHDGVPRARPRRRILVQGVAAIAALLLPIFLLLVWLTAGTPALGWVILGLGLVLILALLSAIQATRIHVRVEDDTLIERSYLGFDRRTPLSEIGGVIVLELQRALAERPKLQLFVVDTHGRLILRMRGEVWSRANIERISDALPNVHHRIDKPVAIREIQLNNPELLYWFERWPRRWL